MLFTRMKTSSVYTTESGWHIREKPPKGLDISWGVPLIAIDLDQPGFPKPGHHIKEWIQVAACI